MKSITMTEAQTEIYDNGTPEEARALIRELAEQLGEEGGEIYTADGIVAEVVQ